MKSLVAQLVGEVLLLDTHLFQCARWTRKSSKATPEQLLKLELPGIFVFIFIALCHKTFPVEKKCTNYGP